MTNPAALPVWVHAVHARQRRCADAEFRGEAQRRSIGQCKVLLQPGVFVASRYADARESMPYKSSSLLKFSVAWPRVRVLIGLRLAEF